VRPGWLVRIYRSRSAGDAEWRPVEQRVPITWTACHLGGYRPWFVCSVYSGGRCCGRYSTRPANCSHAGAAMGWPMRANTKGYATAGWERRGRFESGWEAVQTCWRVHRQAEAHALAHLRAAARCSRYCGTAVEIGLDASGQALAATCARPTVSPGQKPARPVITQFPGSERTRYGASLW
jgi:hypothetical protein